jgi:hypothetical protein
VNLTRLVGTEPFALFNASLVTKDLIKINFSFWLPILLGAGHASASRDRRQQAYARSRIVVPSRLHIRMDSRSRDGNVDLEIKDWRIITYFPGVRGFQI